MTLRLEVVPDKAIVVRRQKIIVASCWFGPFIRRPYIYPFCAPGGVEVTRLGHPGDPVGHSHHRSIWIGHRDVGGVDFWSEGKNTGRIELIEIESRTAQGEDVSVLLSLAWRSPGGRELLRESRRMTFRDLPGDEVALELDIELRAAASPVTLGVTPFGLLGVRVAKTIRVHEKLGGKIVNSEEGENEDGCFGQHAAWCDYSGPVPLSLPRSKPIKGPGPHALSAVVAGIACFDHPKNASLGTQWHVRDDGWMGPSLTRTEARTLSKDKPMRVRYRIDSHAGQAWQARLGERYRSWARKK